MHTPLVLALLLLILASTTWGQVRVTPDSMAQVYYATRARVTIFFEPDSTLPFAHLKRREEVRLLQREGPWWLIQRRDGTRGYVREGTLSNVWLKIIKSEHMLYVYEGLKLTERFPIDLGYNFLEDKLHRSNPENPREWRTPEGVFFICAKNPRSIFYRALLLNYPTSEDARRGLRDSLITEATYRAIVRAEERFQAPPMDTPLGGFIEIHGAGSGMRKDWTRGCIALKNVHIDRLWPLVSVGTPVLILR